MSYLWSDKITDYYYSNPELDTVAVLWTDEEGVVREHYIRVDETDEQWRDFVAEVPHEKIDGRTIIRHEDFREEFREAFKNYARRSDVRNLFTDDPTADAPVVVNEIVFDFMSDYDKTDAGHKEELFRMKLKIFEQDVVKNSKSADKFKNAKTFIRKAENPMDVMLGYMVFTSDAKLRLAPTKKFEVKGVYLPAK
jgi:hypothetical protein